jgi:hypothetical protein
MIGKFGEMLTWNLDIVFAGFHEVPATTISNCEDVAQMKKIGQMK